MYRKCIKRALDIFFSFIALAVLSPLLIITYILALIKLGKPVVFKQTRTGKNGRLFSLYKFRTMTDERDDCGNLLPDEQRQTRFGNFLRSTSVDELLELVNILKGDMSIVGPRPLLPEYLPLYNEVQNRRHEVNSGLSGYAQINGRNAISWEQRFELDVYYVDHESFLLDCKIVILTFWKAFIKRDNINHAGNTTMEKFKGSENIYNA